jgi:hypothetical protein
LRLSIEAFTLGPSCLGGGGKEDYVSRLAWAVNVRPKLKNERQKDLGCHSSGRALSSIPSTTKKKKKIFFLVAWVTVITQISKILNKWSY